MQKNSTLIIAGVGIKFISHLTVETKACIEKAEKVFYLINEPAMKEWIQTANPNAESLDNLYKTYKNREDNYLLIAQHVNAGLEKYKSVCFVMYGHPTFLAQPTIIAANLAAQNNHQVLIMPAVSAEDCLFADLKIDPIAEGCQSFEATDFLLYRRVFSTSSHLVLWQPSVIGLKGIAETHHSKAGLKILVEYLCEAYPLTHQIMAYSAAQYPSFLPEILYCSLQDLPNIDINRTATLYLPPISKKHMDPVMLKKLQDLSI